jgi:hypothetical protein
LADIETASFLTQQWMEALTSHPKNAAVVAGALNLLRMSNPAQALKVINGLSPSPPTKHLARPHLCDVGPDSVTVSAVSIKDGLAIATAASQLSDSGTAASARQALLTSTDVKLVLSGMGTTVDIVKSLATRNALPGGYAAYCQALLLHTHELFPQTAASCDVPTPGSQSLANEVHEAVLNKKIQPRYPPLAKQQGLQGKVEFTAIIGADGLPHTLELLRGPFAFYDESYQAVSQWEWQPTLFNGVPMPVITNIVANYTLQYQ